MNCPINRTKNRSIYSGAIVGSVTVFVVASESEELRPVPYDTESLTNQRLTARALVLTSGQSSRTRRGAVKI